MAVTTGAATTAAPHIITVIEERQYVKRGQWSVWFRAEITRDGALVHITGRRNTRSAAQSDGAAWVLDREGAA